jgi:eukaryotic translation initiation factor 2C
LPLVDVEQPGKPSYIPAELCAIEHGEPLLGKLGPKETLDMLKVASRRPAESAKTIVETGLQRLGLSQSTIPALNAFGIQVANQMIVVPGRELLAPSVTYGKGQLRVADGSWNILDVRFHQGGLMTNWKVLCT